MNVSWKAEVIADTSGKFAGNGLRFATKREAAAYGGGLADRWSSVREMRVVECSDPVTHAWHEGRAVPVEEGGQ